MGQSNKLSPGGTGPLDPRTRVSNAGFSGEPDWYECCKTVAKSVARRRRFQGSDFDDFIGETLTRAWVWLVDARPGEGFECGTDKNVNRKMYLAGVRTVAWRVLLLFADRCGSPPTSIDPDWYGQPQSEQTPMERLVESKDEKAIRAVFEAAETLDDTEKKLFKLIAEEGLSLAAAARKMGVPDHVARRQILPRVINKIQKKLDDLLL